MNIILLSGGSGQRLWPLSNEVRSKQFVTLFKREDGEYESMVQRVYAQINEANPEAKVTIATSRTQVSAIRNQLGDKVGICIEPCRRDTFPAIALAAAYLKDVQGVSDDEGVVICPVDPYVDISYYQAVGRLYDLTCEGKANLSLMGIEPTYPSEKYGYIIPNGREVVSTVSEFKEKPDILTAEGYISKGALWNAGVFGLKLGYLLSKAHELIKFLDYRDLYDRYDECPKISFDYAVAEKESRIQVMRYSGDWKDVGTWNMMAEVMSDAAKGNVRMDDTCKNTNVINELDIPILCMGCKDMVIAASPDGILVSDKEQSSYIKPYVEEIAEEARFQEKSWGTYAVIDAHSGSMTIKVTLRAGNRMKYHSHQHRDEVWTVISGLGRVIVDGVETSVKPGDVVAIKKGQKHTFIADTDINVIEVQVGEEISKQDKIVYNL